MSSDQNLSEDLLVKDKKISEGAYGKVYSVKNKNLVVKRKIVQKNIFGVGCIKECDINIRLRRNENISKLKYVSYGMPFSEKSLSPCGRNYKNDGAHFIFEKCDCDLEKWIYEYYDKNKIYNIILQLCLAVEFIHNNGIIHQDLKLKNILIKDDIIKVTDFGMSMFYCSKENIDFNVVTLDFRPPEIILRNEFDMKADVWSLGCIFLSLINKENFFYSEQEDTMKNNIKNLTDKIPGLIGDELLKTLGITIPENIKEDYIKINSRIFEKYIGNLDLFLNLLRQIFVIDRINVHDVLNHKFFSKDREHIFAYRNKYSKVNKTHIVIRNECDERKWIKEYINEFMVFKNEIWFRYRILFQTVDIFDRLFSIEKEKYDKEENRIRFCSIIYMCIKLFLTENLIPDLKSITVYTPRTLINREKDIMEKIEPFYRETIFEIAEPCDYEKLLSFYCDSFYNATPEQYFSDFKNF